MTDFAIVATPLPGGSAVERDSVAVAFVREALEGVRARGGDADGLLRAAGIDPGLLASDGGRVSASAFGRLWLGVAEALDDEFFGQDSGRMKVGSFATLCHLCIHARTLETALIRACRLLNLLLDDVQVRLEVVGDFAQVTVRDRGGAPRVFAHETLFILLQGLISWLVDRRVVMLRAHFAYPAPAWADEYPRIYARDIVFNRAPTCFRFAADDLRAPVVQTERTAREFLRGAPANFIVKYRNPRSLAAHVRRALKHGPRGFALGFEDFAAELALSPSTLRRRLDAEGTSFRLIKDGLRRDLAIRLLRQSSRGIPDIAAALGFAEPSAFHRAFQKWTGTSPGAFRDRRDTAALV